MLALYESCITQVFFMIKKFVLFFLIILLTNCSAPGTALLGPVFTGATTQSVGRATLSFGTNHIVKKIHQNSKVNKFKSKKIAKKINNFDKESENLLKLNFHR